MKRIDSMKLLLVALIMFLFFSGLASASESVTYSCCNNEGISNGTLFEDFEVVGDWTISTPANTFTEADTTNFITGTQGIKLTGTNSAQQPTITKTVNFNLSSFQNFEMWVYVANVSNLSTSAAIGIYFANTSSFTKFGNVNVLGTELNNGWNHLSYNKTELTLTGGMNLTDEIVRLRVRHNIVAGTVGNVTYDNMRINHTARAKAIIAFDDGNYTVYQNAYPVMNANNQRGVSNTVTGEVGATGFMTLAQNTVLFNAGWDISSHTENHSHLTELSQNQIAGELNNSYDYLVNNGFSRSAGFLAIPYGDWNYTVLDLIKARYLISRSSINGDHQPRYENDSTIGNITYLLKILSVLDTTTNASVKDSINKTINRSGTIILLYHRVVDSPTTEFSTEVTLSNFTAVSNYLASRSDIDVVTLYDSVIVNIPNNTPIIGKTVNINSSGRTTMVTNNYLNDVTVDMFVYPSSNSVNVSVSSCSGSQVTWTEQSNTPIASSRHVTDGCGFPSNSLVFLSIDGASPVHYTTNSTGWVTFDYSGSAGTHSFSLLSSSYGVSQSVIDNTNTMFGATDVIVLLSIIIILVTFGLMALKIAQEGSIDNILGIVLLAIVGLLIILSMVVFVIAPFLGSRM